MHHTITIRVEAGSNCSAWAGQEPHWQAIHCIYLRELTSRLVLDCALAVLLFQLRSCFLCDWCSGTVFTGKGCCPFHPNQQYHCTCCVGWPFLCRIAVAILYRSQVVPSVEGASNPLADGMFEFGLDDAQFLNLLSHRRQCAGL